MWLTSPDLLGCSSRAGMHFILVDNRHLVAVGSRTRGLRTTTLWICAFVRILFACRGLKDFACFGLPDELRD